jgi:NADH:ubiquinone oxidoreductase subunit B-like Fe-S oxidoreductase
MMRKLLFESLVRFPVTESPPSPSDAAVEELASSVDRAARKRLGRSLSVREVDAGSCNGCELEINALNNSFYDIERFGIRFVASPRHADVLAGHRPGHQGTCARRSSEPTTQHPPEVGRGRR